MNTITIHKLLSFAATQLEATSDSARLDAELLLAHALNVDRSYLYTWPEKIPDEDKQQQYLVLVEKRRQGVPIAYLLGEKEFWSLNLVINQHTLIPRPDTELLVELALKQIANIEQAKIADVKIADLGTGSGAIALAIAKECPNSKIYATDKSAQALAIAEKNKQQLGLTNITFLQGSWCAPLPKHDFDLIISNPPYIATDDPHLQAGDVYYEPKSALVAGDDGLSDLRDIIQQACVYLKPGGQLMLEHGYQQANSVRNLLKARGYTTIKSFKDIAGHERVICSSVV